MKCRSVVTIVNCSSQVCWRLKEEGDDELDEDLDTKLIQ